MAVRRHRRHRGGLTLNPKAFTAAVVTAAAAALVVNRVADHLYVRWLGRRHSAPAACGHKHWIDTEFPFDTEAFTPLSGGH